MGGREPDIGFLIKNISEKMHAQADANVKKRGLTVSQLWVLGILHDHGGRATQKEIEIAMRVSHPTTVGLVKRLEKGGFVCSEPDETDRRHKVIVATEKASSLHEGLLADMKRAEGELLKGLNPEERNELIRLLMILYQNVVRNKEV